MTSLLSLNTVEMTGNTHLGKPKDIANILYLQSIVDRHIHTTSRRNPEDTLQERRRIRSQYAYSLESMLLQKVSEAPSSVGEFRISAAQGAVVGRDMENRRRRGLNRCCSG